VDALAALAIDPPITAHVGRFPDAEVDDWLEPAETVVVSAVDTMAGRRAIAEWSRDHGIPLFIDTGVHAEIVVIKTAFDAASYEGYLAGLLDDDKVEDAQCGLKGTAYAGMSIASQLVPLVNGWCRGDTPLAMRLLHTGFFTLLNEQRHGVADPEEVPVAN
jgi:hypothetical protein